jgi:hypothetical protein
MLIVAHWARSGQYRAGWGLAVPATILIVLAVMGRLLRGVGAPASPSPAVVGESSSGGGDGESKPSPSASGEQPALPRLLAALIVIAFAAGILKASFGYAVYAREWSWQPIALLAAAVVALAGWLVRHRRGEPLLWAGTGALVGLVVLWLADRVGLVVLQLTGPGGELKPSALVVSSVLLLGGGFRLFETLSSTRPERPQFGPFTALFVGLGLVVCYVLAVAYPWRTGEIFGVIGILLFFLTIVAVVGALLVWATPVLSVPRALRVVHFSTFPIMMLLVVWFLVAGFLDKGGYHNVRLQQADAPAQGVTLEEALACWRGKNGLEQNRCSEAAQGAAPARGAVPLILVATTGGGIRAAYWTDLVLDCAFEVAAGQPCPRGTHDRSFARSNRLFAMSGISGGSLGLASYAAYLGEKKGRLPETNWVERSLDGDSLSASGAWWLLVEIPRVFLQFRSPTDRAGVLERGWERNWPGGELSRGLFALWRDHPQAPLLLLNGTSVEDGCRFETSVLDGNVETAGGQASGCRSSEPFDDSLPADPTQPPPLKRTQIDARSVLPATRDLVDLLCHDRVDVSLSTAALLSARFPFVNPSGRIERRCDTPGSRRPIAYVVDGGYLDTSGASPLVEAMGKLEPMIDRWNEAHPARCIVPVMIQIDNGFDSAASRPPRRPAELTVPLKTILATRIARAAEGRVGAGLEFSDRTRSSPAVNRYAHFVNQAHPGPHAPLGWTQSRKSERELSDQLTQEKNVRAFAEVRNWLRPGSLICAAR